MRRGYRKGQLTSGRWRKVRDQVIREEPLCRLRLDCCTIRSTTADHIVPVRARPDLKYDRRNLRGSCQPCNMRRGARPLSVVRAEQRQPQKPAPALEFFS
jgi:5-methylcytosine-specific restriction endonuclease McrA